MPITIVGKPGEITYLADRFPADYHRDFDRVRTQARAYLAAKSPGGAAWRLAPLLSQALRRWGAGRRSAPGQQSATRIACCLASPRVHAALVALEIAATARPGTRAGRRTFKSVPSIGISVAGFDRHLFRALEFLARGLFLRCRNVTYPMKAVLLITGLMPAFDSQVRGGLQRAGLLGMSSTRFLLPSGPRNAGWLKISRLPFLLGECFSVERHRVQAEIRHSRHPILNSDPGRIFDVLLFMQGYPGNPLVINYSGSSPWYDMP